MSLAGVCAEVESVIARARSLFGSPERIVVPAAGEQLSTAATTVSGAQARTSELCGTGISGYRALASAAVPPLRTGATSETTMVTHLGSAAAITQAGATRMDQIAATTATITRLAPAARTPAHQRIVLAALRSQLAQTNQVVSATQQQGGALAGQIRALTYPKDAPQTLGGDLPKRPAPGTDPKHPKKAPKDPREFRDWWTSLTPEEKDAAFAADHNIGNHDGMPTADRDHYGKLNLAEQLAGAQAAASRADALEAEHPGWADVHAGGADPGYQDTPGYKDWKSSLDAANHDARYLPDLQAVDRALQADPDRKLLLLDTTSGTQVRAAISAGDPDTATHVSVTTPGLNTTVHGAVESMAGEATAARQQALVQLQSVPGRQDDSVAAIAWIGYDPPQINANDGVVAALSGIWGVTQNDLAQAGAVDLGRFYDGLVATHQGPVDLSAIGHSYGSLTTSLALQTGDHGVARALFYGSPGIEASTPADLHLQAGQVFTMAAPDDKVVQGVYGAKILAYAIPGAGPLLASTLGDFGPNPDTNPNFTQLATTAETVHNGHQSTFLEPARGHSQYPRFPDNGGIRTTNYNIAAIIAGTTPIEEN